ncbi:transcription factor bHLH93-like [Silene latifolia]|uniref:transcription factor bHLH93-like n=1 Tax=Silene latifolia TaxID=37657 RepID=UPI003D7777DF
MEIKEDGFLEELVGLTRETCTPWMSPNNDSTDELTGCLFSPTTGTWSSGPGADFGNLHSSTANSSYESFSSSLDCSAFYPHHPLSVNPFTGPEGEYSVSLLDIPTTFNTGLCSIENNNSTTSPSSGNAKSKVKKVHGQPSKNLMAERRRRKRLNDRLAMLRSVVPKISKMDRTSILGDTIDYMKELLEKINNLQESDDVGSNQFNVVGIFKDAKPNDLVRNSPKFDVERRESDTRVEMCCAGKPGLLLSTVTTLEALGLEIQQCVISCFNDFSLQASCSQGSLLGSEDIKQALFRNAGYGGRCL